MGVMKRAAALNRRVNYGRMSVGDAARMFTGKRRVAGRLHGAAMEVGLSLAGAARTNQNFEQLSEILKRRILKKSMTAAAGVIRKEVKLKTPRKTGLLRRSLGSKVVKYQGGVRYLAVIGQAKGLEKQKGFSAAALKATSHKKRGGLSGEGVVLPLWLVNSAVSAHAMPGSKRKKRDPSKPYVFDAGGRRNYRKHIPNHPGHTGAQFIERGAAAAERPTATAFRRKFKGETAKAMRALRNG